MTGPFLSIRSISMRFGGLQALNDVSFDIERGTIVGLIGPNGSGKTTLMNVISGAYKPSAGAVCFKGRRIADVAAYDVCKLGIARTFQVSKPLLNLTVRENVAIGAMYGRSGKTRSTDIAFAYADEVLETVSLKRVATRQAADLTIPDRKRLEVAKALALDPELLLLDEVMAGLNHYEIDEALGLLRRLRDHGITLIVVEHVMKAITVLSGTVIVLAEGKKIAEGAPFEVMKSPLVIEAYLGARYAKRQERTLGRPSLQS